jgi:methylenetetrahydrofolate reductase (NADPH)
VTWGVFPGHEVANSTIIERESFLSWKVHFFWPAMMLWLFTHLVIQDEAFSIWQDWASFYAPGSPQRTLLEEVHAKRWLVSVVHHDYRDSAALWSFLNLDE